MINTIKNRSVYRRMGYGEPCTASRYARNVELADVIIEAIEKLSYEYRTVLVLWCFDQSSWGEIAGLMDSNKKQVHVQFYCAKWALECSLAASGFSRSLLPDALGMYGFKIGMPMDKRLPGMLYRKLEEN